MFRTWIPLPPEDAYSAYLKTEASPIDLPDDQPADRRRVYRLRTVAVEPRVFDDYLYEPGQIPTESNIVNKQKRPPVPTRPKAPPFAEVISAKALNDLFFDLRSLRFWGAFGKSIPLDGLDLERINVTTFKSSGHIGLLKKEGPLDWPAQLRQESFRPERLSLERLLPEAVRQATKRRAEASTLRELRGALDEMQKRLASAVADVPPVQYAAARHFLSDLDAAVKVLEQPDACFYLTHKYAARGQTVPELVRYMDRHSLKFAPASAGDEAAYVELYRALAACDAYARAQASTAPR
jgi:hypothetical protein